MVTLADILSSKSSTRTNLRSSTRNQRLVPSLEDLQKKLDGGQDSNSKLNFSRAFSLTSVDLDSFSFAENGTEPSNSAEPSKPEVKEQNDFKVNDKIVKHSRRNDRRTSSQEEKLNSLDSFSQQSLNDDSHREIVHIIGKIEKGKFGSFQNDFKDKKIKSKPEFNLIHLPEDFKLDYGKVNVYRSGVVEIISGDIPPKTIRCKQFFQNSTNVTTDLMISTDTLVHINHMNLFTPEELG